MSRLTFLGTGTSQGVPVIACGCWVCSSEDRRDKRLRCSVLIEVNGLNIVIDAGPDFREQMLQANVKRLDAILLTHAHKDHISGLDDVRAYNYVCSKPMDIYAEEITQQTIRKDFDYAFSPNPYPGVPEMNLITIDEKPFQIDNVNVIPIRGDHFNLPVLGFRIGELAYLTDMNKISEDSISKIKGVDTLVINALRKEHHISHFSLDEALHISYLVGAKRTFLTHVSHQMGRYSQINPTLPQGVQFAYDGLTIDID